MSAEFGKNTDLQTQVLLLYAVAMMQPVTTKELCSVLQVSRMTLNRQFMSLATNFGVLIRFDVQKIGEPGRHGSYSIASWGVINAEASWNTYATSLANKRMRSGRPNSSFVDAFLSLLKNGPFERAARIFTDGREQ